MKESILKHFCQWEGTDGQPICLGNLETMQIKH
jgi:hypothetical protein